MYVLPTSGPATVLTMTDTQGTGTVQVNTTVLTGGTLVSGKTFTWADGAGTQYVFAPGAGAVNVGTLTITGGTLGTGSDQIVIQNFDLNAAETSANGALGLKFAEQVALTTDPSQASDPFLTGNYAPANGAATVPTGGVAQSVTVFASAVSDVPQTVALTFSGATLSDFSAVINGQLQALTSSMVVTIAPGADSATIGLIATQDVVNGKPAIEWLMEGYVVTVDKNSGIRNDSNVWSNDCWRCSNRQAGRPDEVGIYIISNILKKRNNMIYSVSLS